MSEHADPSAAKVVTLAMALPLEEGMAALARWKGQERARWWVHYEDTVSALLVRAIETWPGSDMPGLAALLEFAQALMAETASGLGIPPELWSFVAPVIPEKTDEH